MVISQNTDQDAKFIVQFAERLSHHIASLKIGINTFQVQVTVSIGVAKKEKKLKTEDELMSVADKVLYAAKNSGRNKTCLYFQDKILSCNLRQ